MPSYTIAKRGTRFLVLAVVLLFVLPALLYHQGSVQNYFNATSHTLPPLYEEYHAREQDLEHYKEYERRKDVKYLWAQNHQHNVGWGNVMQDAIMNALLAHATGRSYVFGNYQWNPDGSKFSNFNGHLIPSQIPLTALLGGLMVGGPMPPGDTTPRAVSKPFFNKVCPKPSVVYSTEVNDDRMRFDDSVPASFVFEKWVEKIKSIDDPCLVIDGNPIFEVYILGNKRMLAIWSYLGISPVTTQWEWSPLIHDAYKRNRQLFVPESSTRSSRSRLADNYAESIPGLLALHVRRGDFQEHCVNLAKWSSNWNAFNMFPEFIDKYQTGTTEEESVRIYLTHCFPTIEEIVQKVTQVRIESEQPLTHIYVMTNGPVPWVAELKEALGNTGDWDQIETSRDLDLTWEQKYVAQALDMFVAQRAEVLIGNGWSSLTSNVVMLRMAQDFPPNSNRFW